MTYDPWDPEHQWRQVQLVKSLINAATPETAARTLREVREAARGASIGELLKMREEV